MKSEPEERNYLTNPIPERDLDFTIKALEKSGAEDISSVILVHNQSMDIVYPPQYIVSFKGKVDEKKFKSFFYC